MKPQKQHWSMWIGYAVVCLAYAVWIVFLGLNNFDMVHDGYRQAGERLQPERIREAALRELVAECRREGKIADRPRHDEAGFNSSADLCTAFSETVIEERRQVLHKRLHAEWGRAWRKLMLFYLFFGIVFLVLPMFMLYLLLSFLLWLRRNLRIVK